MTTAEFDGNLHYISAGFTRFVVGLSVTPWRVGPEDQHLNEHATDQVKDLVTKVVDLMPAIN